MQLSTPHFDLAATVESGHLFAYEMTRDGYRITNGDHTFVVQQPAPGLLAYTGASREDIVRFFDLDKHLDGLHERLAKDRVLKPLLTRYRGVRLVRQELRQAVATFILSSNNNQPRIKRMVAHLLSLKEPYANHDEAALREAMFGYRADYLAAASRLLTDEYLARLRDAPYDEGKHLLCTLPGVGPKVADCILAYSELARGEAFPADVWVRRALRRWYHFRKPLTDKNITAWARRRFGGDGAYAQHYLFLAAQATMRKSQQTR